jgi:hypothetical protein
MMIEHVPLGRFAHLVAHSKCLDEAHRPAEVKGKINIRKGPKSWKSPFLVPPSSSQLVHVKILGPTLMI